MFIEQKLLALAIDTPVALEIEADPFADKFILRNPKNGAYVKYSGKKYTAYFYDGEYRANKKPRKRSWYGPVTRRNLNKAALIIV